MSVAAPLVLREGDRSRLEALTRSSSIRAGLAQRARIVLLAAEGLPEHRDRAPGRGVAPDGDRLAGPLRRGRARRAAGPAAQRVGRRRIDEVEVVVATLTTTAARRRARGDALVEPAAGRRAGDLASPRWRGSGASGTCSPGGSRRSSSPPTPSSTPRSATWSGSICTRRRRPWCSASTRSRQVQALHRTAPILPMRARAAGEGHPRLHPQRHHHAVRRARGGHRQGRRRLPAPAPPPGVPALPQAGRQGLPAAAAAHGLRQLRHPQTPRGARPGWPATRGSPCTSPRPRGPG